MDNRIEEMANDLQEAWTAWSLSKDLKTPYAFVAEILAKKWHPKIPEGVVDYIENYKEGFKEGVEALKIQAKERKFEIVTDAGNREDVVFVEDIDEICKELVD